MTAVLFDFDGTIMDTEPAIMASYRYLFQKYRKEEDFTKDVQTMVLGPSLDAMMPVLFPDQSPARMVQEYRDYQKAHARIIMKPMQYAPEVLGWLKSHGYPLGIITTRYHKSAEEILNEQDMRQYFDLIIGHEDVRKDKPDPEGIQRACEMLKETECIYVGDSATDIEAGKNAGAFTIALVSNERKRQQLINAAPDEIIENLNDLIAIMEKKVWKKK